MQSSLVRLNRLEQILVVEQQKERLRDAVLMLLWGVRIFARELNV